jgi:hypothetical protein
MAESALLVTLEIDGKVCSDFDGITINSVTKYVQVPLMGKTNHAKVTERHTIVVNYVEPLVPPFDPTDVAGGVITVDWEGGGRHTYSGVHCLETGDGAVTLDTAFTHPIQYGAESLIKE